MVADDTSLGVAGNGDRQGIFLRQIPVAGRHFKQRNALFVVWGTLQWGPKRHFWACMADNAVAQPGFAVSSGRDNVGSGRLGLDDSGLDSSGLVGVSSGDWAPAVLGPDPKKPLDKVPGVC